MILVYCSVFEVSRNPYHPFVKTVMCSKMSVKTRFLRAKYRYPGSMSAGMHASMSAGMFIIYVQIHVRVVEPSKKTYHFHKVKKCDC